MKEKWIVIDEFPNYKISNFGRVKSTVFHNNLVTKKRDKVLKIQVNNNNRAYVSLRRDGHRKNCLVHRLVGNAFLPNENNLPQINHIDGNPTNNVVSNLEWCTASYNAKHAYENRLNSLKEYNEARKKTIIRNDGKIYESAYSAATDNSCTVYSIRDALKGRIKTCKGYTFKYKQ